MKMRIGFFCAVAAASLALGLFLPGRLLEPVFNHAAYYFISASALAWGAVLVKVGHGRFLALIRRNYPALLLAAGLMAAISNISPPKFKVLADETNLVGTSMAMYFNRTVAMPDHGFGLEYYPFDYKCDHIDRRPLLFPFAVSVVHSVFGYSPFNGLVVNFVAGVLAMFTLYLMLARVFSKPWGMAGMLLLASFPVFITCSTSSGFETLNLFFIILCLYLLYRFLEERSADYAELLFFSLVMLAQCRYESAFFLLALVVLLPFFINKDIVTSYRPAVLLAPILLVPLVWQRRIGFLPTGVRLGIDGPSLVPQHTYAVGNLVDNFSKNIFVLSGLNPYYGFLPLVFLAAVMGAYFISKRWVTGFSRIEVKHRAVTGYGALCCITLFVVYSSYIWGVFTLGIDNRLALAFLPFLIVPAVYWVFRLVNGRVAYTRLFLFLVAAHMVFYWPVAARQPLVATKSMTYLYNRTIDWLYLKYNPKKEHILLVTDWPNLYTVHGIGAIGFAEANRLAKKVRYLDDIYYDQIVVSQRYDLKTNQPIEADRLAGPFKLTPLKRIDVGPEFYIVLSAASVSDS